MFTVSNANVMKTAKIHFIFFKNQTHFFFLWVTHQYMKRLNCVHFILCYSIQQSLWCLNFHLFWVSNDCAFFFFLLNLVFESINYTKLAIFTHIMSATPICVGANKQHIIENQFRASAKPILQYLLSGSSAVASCPFGD